MVQNVSVKREFEAGLCYVTTGKLSLSNPAVTWMGWMVDWMVGGGLMNGWIDNWMEE